VCTIRLIDHIRLFGHFVATQVALTTGLTQPFSTIYVGIFPLSRRDITHIQLELPTEATNMSSSLAKECNEVKE
jgi:hypothetical protein